METTTEREEFKRVFPHYKEGRKEHSNVCARCGRRTFRSSWGLWYCSTCAKDISLQWDEDTERAVARDIESGEVLCAWDPTQCKSLSTLRGRELPGDVGEEERASGPQYVILIPETGRWVSHYSSITRVMGISRAVLWCQSVKAVALARRVIANSSSKLTMTIGPSWSPSEGATILFNTADAECSWVSSTRLLGRGFLAVDTWLDHDGLLARISETHQIDPSHRRVLSSEELRIRINPRRQVFVKVASPLSKSDIDLLRENTSIGFLGTCPDESGFDFAKLPIFIATGKGGEECQEHAIQEIERPRRGCCRGTVVLLTHCGFYSSVDMLMTLNEIAKWRGARRCDRIIVLLAPGRGDQFYNCDVIKEWLVKNGFEDLNTLRG